MSRLEKIVSFQFFSRWCRLQGEIGLSNKIHCGHPNNGICNSTKCPIWKDLGRDIIIESDLETAGRTLVSVAGRCTKL